MKKTASVARAWRRGLGLAVAGALCACGGGDQKSAEAPVSIQFEPRVGDLPYACDQSYQLGTPPSPVKPLGLRLYVSEVFLVRAGGERVPVALDDDGKFQGGGVTLLELAKHEGSCTQGAATTHTAVKGSVPAHDDYTGLAFHIGVPSDVNHLNAAKQVPPLNDPDMFWSWQDGHVFMKVTWSATNSPVWEFALAESVAADGPGQGCQGSDAQGYECPSSFQGVVELPKFDVAKDKVKLDLATLFKHIDFTKTDYTSPEQQPSSDPAKNADLDYDIGCRMAQWDAECTALLQTLGIDYVKRTASDPDKQTFVSTL